MKKLVIMVAIALAVSVGSISAASAYTTTNPTYSTNDYNRNHGGPHVDLLGSDGHTVTLAFVNPNNYSVCFEYRTDGDTSQKIAATNFNSAITDGLYPFLCLSTAGTQVKTFTVAHYVEARSVFGAERDWDFTWTTFSVRRGGDCQDSARSFSRCDGHGDGHGDRHS